MDKEITIPQNEINLVLDKIKENLSQNDNANAAKDSKYFQTSALDYDSVVKMFESLINISSKETENSIVLTHGRKSKGCC